MPRRYRSDWRCEVAHARAVSIQETEYVIDIIKHVTVNFVCHIGLVFFFLYLSFLASASGQRAHWMYFVTMPLGISTWNVQSPTFKLFSRNILWAESRASFIILAIFVNCEIFPFIDKQTRLQPVIHIRAPAGCAYATQGSVTVWTSTQWLSKNRGGFMYSLSRSISTRNQLICKHANIEIIVLPEAEGGAARSRGTSSLTSVQAVWDLECSQSLAALVINN